MNTEPMLGDAIPNIIKRANDLLEWVPKCSPGSSGDLRQAALREAVDTLEVAYALARL